MSYLASYPSPRTVLLIYCKGHPANYKALTLHLRSSLKIPRRARPVTEPGLSVWQPNHCPEAGTSHFRTHVVLLTSPRTVIYNVPCWVWGRMAWHKHCLTRLITPWTVHVKNKTKRNKTWVKKRILLRQIRKCFGVGLPGLERWF